MVRSTSRALKSSAERGDGRRRGQDDELSSAFRKSVEDGHARLSRTWPGLVATGLVGGIDLGIGVAALALVQAETGSRSLGALAFTIGFVALTLARSELFTENFLVPVAAVVARRSSIVDLLRLWIGTLVMNLVAGWGVAALIVAAFPHTHATLLEIGRHYPDLGIGWESFAAGILGGAVITLMTWMERNSATELGRVVAAVAMSFLLAAGPLNHVIVSSVEMFTALHVGASFGYAQWAGATAWAMLTNVIGGLGLVTVLRFIQVGAADIVEHRRAAQIGPDEGRDQSA